MTDASPRLLVTGANGQLGRLVIDRLRARLPDAAIVAGLRDAARDPGLGVPLRTLDYDRPETLDPALAGIDRVLLISSTALGHRVAQHRRVIEAASRAGIRLLAYTSVLHADISPLGLAVEHLQTETLIRQSGIPFVLLRNGWYTENHLAALPAVLAQGAIIGSAGEGRFSTAPRLDYAEAAAAVLCGSAEPAGRVFELAGDASYTLAELAIEITLQSGRTIAYHDMPEATFRGALHDAGLPDAVAAMLADSDAQAARGALFDDGGQLSALIGRPTTPLASTVTAALARL